MRLKDDEVRMMRFLVDRRPFEITGERSRSILKTFRYHGFIDENDELTTRGRHVADSLPPIPEPIPEPDDIEPIEETDWD
jgi:hypothetical protein